MGGEIEKIFCEVLVVRNETDKMLERQAERILEFLETHDEGMN